MREEDFQFYKSIGIIASLSLIMLLQFIVPYRENLRDLFRNMGRNSVLAVVNLALIVPFCAGCICSLAEFARVSNFGLFNVISTPEWVGIVFSVFALDLTAYAWHQANHRNRFLWRFHSVHHSDRFFDASTAFRFHFGEIIFSIGIRASCVLVLGLPVLGILLFELIYGFFNVFEHGNIKMSLKLENILSKIFITPGLHRKHHSTKKFEMNSNYGTVFSIWDRLFGTKIEADSHEQITNGLPNQVDDPTVLSLLIMPVLR